MVEFSGLPETELVHGCGARGEHMSAGQVLRDSWGTKSQLVGRTEARGDWCPCWGSLAGDLWELAEKLHALGVWKGQRLLAVLRQEQVEKQNGSPGTLVGDSGVASSSCNVSPAPSTDKLNLILAAKKKCLKGPAYEGRTTGHESRFGGEKQRTTKPRSQHVSYFVTCFVYFKIY